MFVQLTKTILMGHKVPMLKDDLFKYLLSYGFKEAKSKTFNVPTLNLGKGRYIQFQEEGDFLRVLRLKVSFKNFNGEWFTHGDFKKVSSYGINAALGKFSIEDPIPNRLNVLIVKFLKCNSISFIQDLAEE